MKRIRRKKKGGGRNKIPMAGKTFGRLSVIRDSGERTKYGKSVIWLCRCSCGARKKVWGNLLRKGLTRSCGRCIFIKHGMARTREYATWQSMIRRCANLENPNYGGRGIRVSPRYLGESGFINFFADMGRRPEGCSLDRIDNDGHYAPGNLRWATPTVQANNRRNPVRSVEEELGIM
jgi:hypothetical protein